MPENNAHQTPEQLIAHWRDEAAKWRNSSKNPNVGNETQFRHGAYADLLDRCANDMATVLILNAKAVNQ